MLGGLWFPLPVPEAVVPGRVVVAVDAVSHAPDFPGVDGVDVVDVFASPDEAFCDGSVAVLLALGVDSAFVSELLPNVNDAPLYLAVTSVEKSCL